MCDTHSHEKTPNVLSPDSHLKFLQRQCYTVTNHH